MEYLWQPATTGCLYHLVEPIFRSGFHPVRGCGFLITADHVCNEEEATFYKQEWKSSPASRKQIRAVHFRCILLSVVWNGGLVV